MNAELRFVDTNVLVYLFDGDAESKQERARELLREGHCAERTVISTQVLGEFYVSVTRKLATPLDPDRARRAVEDLCAFTVAPIRSELVLAAIRRSQRSKLSYWDGLIVETAIDAGAAMLLTEDLKHGQVFDSLRVVNPFCPGS